MKHSLKKVLALTLCAALGLSLVGGAFAADAPTAAPTTAAAETSKPGTFDLGAICTDDGQYVSSVVLHLEKPAGATAAELKDALTVTVKGFTINFYGFIVKENADMPRIIDNVAVSEDGLTVTLTLRYTGEGIDFLNGDTLAAKTDFELHNGTYAVTVTKDVGTLTTESAFTYSGKLTDPEEVKWGAVDKTDTEYNYRYFDPAQDGYEMPENGYALVVWLHGAGESVQTVDGEPVYDNKLQITANRVTAWGQKETQDMFGGAYVIAPQMDGLKNPNGWGWNPEVVMATIKAFIEKVGPKTVDMSRIVIGGCSMGGMGTWATIKAYPYFFSAAFPTCGASDFTDEDIANLMHLPIYCIHTVEDGTVNISGTLNAYDTLTAAGKTNIYLALYEHTWTVGAADSTPEDLAALAANGHSSWIYTHNDIDGEKAGDKYFIGEKGFTYESTGKTYYNTKPSTLGYKSFHDWLAGQKNAAPSPFKDVTPETANREAIMSLALSGVIKGVTPNTFAPDAALTRAQFVTLIARAMGVKVDNTQPTGFTDVAANGWASGAVKWAADNGLVQGYGNGKFGPSDPLTQEQVNTIVGRYVEKYGTVLLQGYAEPTGLATRGSVVPIIANIAATPNFVIIGKPAQYKDLDPRAFRTWGQYLSPEDYLSSSTTYDYTEALTLFEENTFTNPDKNADALTKEIKYFVYDPTEHGADPKGTYPVIYWFHGAGNAVDTEMSATCVGYAGAAMFATKEYQEKMGAAYIVVPLANETKPNGQNAGTWGTTTADGKTSIYSQVLDDLMDAFMKEHKDTVNGKLVIAGTSAGGYMACRYMLDHTSTVSGALLMAPAYTFTDEDLAKIDSADFPIWHVHGIHDELCAYSRIVTPVEEKLKAMDNYDLTPFEWVRHGDHSIATLNVGIEMGQHCICNEVGANLMFDDGTPMAESHPDGVTGWFKTVFEG